MAKVFVEAVSNIQRTKTIEVKVRIQDVKEWMKEEYGSRLNYGYQWNDEEVLEEYFQSHEELIDEAEGNIDEITEGWEVQHAEEM